MTPAARRVEVAVHRYRDDPDLRARVDAIVHDLDVATHAFRDVQLTVPERLAARHAATMAFVAVEDHHHAAPATSTDTTPKGSPDA